MATNYTMTGGYNHKAVGRRKKIGGKLGLYNPPEFLNTRVGASKEMRESARRPKMREVPKRPKTMTPGKGMMGRGM